MSLSQVFFYQFLRPLRVRGKFRFLSPLLASTGTRKATVFGSKMSLDISDHIQRGVYLGSYEFNETRWVRTLLQPGDTAIDVGANCGYYTTLFAQQVGPAGRVVAIEPNPNLAVRLHHIIEQNALRNVELIPAGASDKEGNITLYIPPAEDHMENATMAPMPSWQPVNVPIVRLAEVCSSRGLNRIKLLKLDIEGHEVNALLGMEELLRKGTVSYLLIELNDYWLREQGRSSEYLMKLCNDLGFRRIAFGRVSSGSVLLEWCS